MLDGLVALCQSDRLYCGIPSLSVIAIGDTGWKSQWNMGIPYCVSDMSQLNVWSQERVLFLNGTPIHPENHYSMTEGITAETDTTSSTEFASPTECASETDNNCQYFK